MKDEQVDSAMAALALCVLAGHPAETVVVPATPLRDVLLALRELRRERDALKRQVSLMEEKAPS